MKKILITILLAQSILSCAQTIKPLNTPSTRLNQGDYEKDINNEFTPFIGTWEGTWNNKKITLYISKVTNYYKTDSVIGYYYEDFVIGKYIIIDLNTGDTIEDTTNVTNIDNVTIKSCGIARNQNMLPTLYMQNTDNLNDCNIICFVNLYRNLTNPNILTYRYAINTYEYENCQYTNVDDIPVNIPKQEVILHKI